MLIRLSQLRRLGNNSIIWAKKSNNIQIFRLAFSDKEISTFQDYIPQYDVRTHPTFDKYLALILTKNISSLNPKCQKGHLEKCISKRNPGNP